MISSKKRKKEKLAGCNNPPENKSRQQQTLPETPFDTKKKQITHLILESPIPLAAAPEIHKIKFPQAWAKLFSPHQSFSFPGGHG
ncbi:hypothetical protein IMZ48_21630 [Candidatus Bathyarchaeota archaeon]|nr:hypothetical protein [Candidatus Bathyarchaeota archaeon]